MKRPRLPVSALTRKSLADVTRRKGRTLLVVLGIVVGVFGLTAINVAAGTMTSAFAYSQNESQHADVILRVSSVTPASLSSVQALPNVKVVQTESAYNTRWKITASPGHANIGITAYDDITHVQLDPFQLTSGRYPGVGEIVMEFSDRGLQQFAIGDAVTVDSPSGPQQLRVVGISRTVGQDSAVLDNFAWAYMSQDGLRALADGSARAYVSAQVNDTKRVLDTAQAARQALEADGVKVQDTRINNNSTIDQGPLPGVFAIMRVLSLIALLLTSFLIVNTVTTLVAEQTKIIGTMKAIGATRRTVMRGYLTSVGVYAVAGTALGLAAGFYAGYAFSQFLSSLIILDLGPFSVDPGIVAVSAAVGLGVPLLAALLPLWNGTRITVREAMTAYGVSANGNSRARGRLARRLPFVSQTTWLGVRGLFRRRGRAVLTLLALTLSATAFLSIQTASYSTHALNDNLFNQFDTDAFVNISSPQPYNQMQQLMLSVPNVARVERFEQTNAKSRWGTVFVQAVEPDTQIYQRDVLQGRWFAGDETNAVLINETTARVTGLKVGDTLTLTTGSRSVTWTIIGVARDLNSNFNTIGNAIATISNLHAFEGIPADVGSSFFVAASDRSTAAVDRMASALDDTLGSKGLTPSVSTAQQEKARNQTQFGILDELLYAVAAIVALVGILGLFNTLTTSVLERRREIGILRSMGATSRRVAGVFWTEGMALAGISWVLAIAPGIPAAYGFVALISSQILPVPFVFNPVSLAVMLVFTFVIASLASVLPALRAAHIRIADTLRYE